MQHYANILVSFLKQHPWKNVFAVMLVGLLFLVFPSVIHRTPPRKYEIVTQEELPEPDNEEVSVFHPFPFPDELKPQVDFWISVFTQYTTKQAIIHDDRYLNVIYEVIDISSDEFPSEKEGWEAVKKARRKYEILLDNLSKHWGQAPKMTKHERRLYKLFKDIPESNYFKKKDASQRVHVQVGQADRFKNGIIQSGRYLKEMKRIFTEEGVPEKLVYLPLIESAFNPHAHSHAGASGMWQFMRSTGKEYGLRITYNMDERRDPLKATRAAAQLLGYNYEKSQSWPFAITAYNFGLRGILNAAEHVGSEEIADIIEQYRGSRFGYASRNFYVEFLAAVDVFLRYTEYFGEIVLEPPLQLVQIRLPDYVSVRTLEKYDVISQEELQDLNPALNSSVFQKGYFLPKQYDLNIPADKHEAFETKYASIPKTLKYAYRPVKARHKVRKGETLSVIARRYDTSIKALMRTNGISNARRLRAGKVLKIPGGYVTVAQKSSNPSTSNGGTDGNTHIIQKGQTLSSIAQMYHTSITSLASLNNITNPRRLRPGQTLKIPDSSDSNGIKAEHKVRKGQTLSTIAKLHKSSVKAISAANNITNPRRIKPGQVLKIPEG